jgi:hypothetical protein
MTLILPWNTFKTRDSLSATHTRRKGLKRSYRASFFLTKLYQKTAKKPGFPLDFATDAWDYILYNGVVTVEKKIATTPLFNKYFYIILIVPDFSFQSKPLKCKVL